MKQPAEIRRLERTTNGDVFDHRTGIRPATADEHARRLARLTPYIEEKRDRPPTGKASGLRGSRRGRPPATAARPCRRATA
jgi:hypothetical protein